MVASVGKISSGSGYDYLTNAVATDPHDYYTGAGEAAGTWAGAGRHQLALDGEVVTEGLKALYGRVLDPRTDGDEREVTSVAGYDVVFSPARSVTLLWALSESPDVRASVIASHEHAVDAGIMYLESNAGHARTGRGGVRRASTSGFIVAKFCHRMARPADPSRLGAPLLHTHCAILNRVRTVDGKWLSADGEAIYSHAHAAGALYATMLEFELSGTLGVAWMTPDDGAAMREIVGVDLGIEF